MSQSKWIVKYLNMDFVSFKIIHPFNHPIIQVWWNWIARLVTFYGVNIYEYEMAIIFRGTNAFVVVAI